MKTDTPETDSAYIQRPNEGAWDFRVRQEKTMEKLERERDEAREELTAVTEQRDRLADLVKQFVSILDITEESDSGRLFHPTNITSCRAGDLQKIGELVEALRRASRTTNPNEL